MKPLSYRMLSVACVLLVSGAFAPRSAFAQTEEGWQVDLAPLYFWAATTDGNLAINGTRNIPVYMDFADTKSKLAGAFALHVEALNGRWGVLGDVNFVRLSSDADYTTPIVGAPIAGTLKLDQLIFNAALMYEVKPGTKFLVVGGIRTMSMSPSAHFTGPVGGQLADIDVNKTVVAGVGGFVYRPKLANRVMLMTQAVVAAVGRARPHASPADLLPLVNDVLYENVRGRLRIRDFVTCSLLRYRADGSITYAGAHEIALIVRATGAPELLPVSGTWLAQRPDVRDVTVDSHAHLGPGDLLVLYTDGLTEARDATGEQFGFDRLVDTVLAARDAPVTDVCTAILDAAAAWTAVQEDDRTVVVARQSQGA